MNKLTKPISSPGRTDKFPPPLMRFLRSNVGSKSRRRSRASPIFLRKKNTLIETTNNQEPSSPKVTCIGQVRSNRNKKPAAASSHHRRHRHRNRPCRCLRNLKPRSCRSVWSKWVSFFRCGSCKNSEDLQVSPVIKPTLRNQSLPYPSPNTAGNNGEQQEQEQDQADNIHQGLIPGSMPKNALLLTRCRSAPYRSSSLASIFKESTMAKTGEDEVAEELKNLKVRSESINGGEESKPVKASPLILTRCKSEPARRWDQLLV